MIQKGLFGVLKSGEPVSCYRMTNQSGMAVRVLDYACVIQSLFVPDRTGNLRDVVLGYDAIDGYEAGNCFLGAFVGRFANRIADASFTVDDVMYRLEANEGKNHLHGTFAFQCFDGMMQENSLIFHKVIPDGEEGYPGNLDLTVTYTLTEDNRLILDYQAETDHPTVINLTNHSYFNLNGQSSGDVLNTRLTLHASQFTEADQETLATGRILPVDNTPMDFRTGKALGRDIRGDHPMLLNAQGYDLNYVLDEPSLKAPSAVAVCEESGIIMRLYTTQPGVQLYTGNFLPGDTAPCGKAGIRYPQYAGFCLETQHFPCSPNHPHFPNTILRPGERFHQVTIYEFGVKQLHEAV